MKHKKILAAIFILALFFRIIFVFITPAFQQPDEEAHFKYVLHMAAGSELPVQGHFYSEYFQPPAYYFLASFLLNFAGLFTQNILHQVLAVRLFSVILGMLTLYFTYKISSLLLKEDYLILSAAAFVAFLPSNISSNANITNANLADFLSTLIVYMLLAIIAKGRSLKKVILLGIVAGISLLTRLSAIPAVMMIPAAFALKEYPNIKKILKPILIIAVIAFAVSGWLFFRNFTLYGDFLGYNAMKLSTPPDNREHNLIFAARLIGWTFVSFWAAFGRTNNIFIGNLLSLKGAIIFAAAYFLIFLISILSVTGLYIFFRKYRKNSRILSSMQKKAVVIFVLLIALMWVSFISFNLYEFQPQGRYFFPAMPAIAVLFAFGIYSLSSKINKRKLFLLFIDFFIAIDLASVLSVVLYYLK